MLAVTLCLALPASVQAVNARWRHFGHVMRINENVPARQAMTCYLMIKATKVDKATFVLLLLLFLMSLSV